MASGVSLQGAIAKAFEIRKLIANREEIEIKTLPELQAEFAEKEGGKIKPGEKTRRLAQSLYRDAVEMVAAELSGNSYIHDETTVHPIIADLHEALKYPGYEGYVGVQRTLSKVFRVFVEMAWYQPWRMDQEIPVKPEFRDGLIEIAGLMKKILKTQENTTGANFELRCAKQAAQRLKPASELWKKYLMLLGDTAVGVAGRSIPAVWDALKNLAEELYQDNPGRGIFWYPKVHILRWESTRVQTEKDFEEKIVKEILVCKNEGDNLSLCLATVLIELIKRPDVDQEVKERALFGRQFKSVRGEPHDGLIHLIKWEHQETIQEYKKYPSEIVRKVLRRGDRFWETRDLTAQFLIKLANQKQKYPEYNARVLVELQSRKEELKPKQSKAHSNEVRLFDQVSGNEPRYKSVTKELRRVGTQRLALEPDKRGAKEMDEETRKAKYDALTAQMLPLREEHKALEEEKRKHFNAKVQAAIVDYEFNLFSSVPSE